MVVGRRQRNFNLGNWLLLAGLLGLGATFWVPFAAAGRSSRVEGRADAIAGLLLREAAAAAPLDPGDPFTQQVLTARVRRACEGAAVYALDLEAASAPTDAGAVLWLRNKHYLFQLARSPVDRAERELPGAAPALEVLAWPAGRPSPGHAVFFHSETADAAFSRNLQRDYAGSADRPLPGAGQRRADPLFEQPWAYRGNDDERWLVVRTAPRPGDVRSTRTGSR